MVPFLLTEWNVVTAGDNAELNGRFESGCEALGYRERLERLASVVFRDTLGDDLSGNTTKYASNNKEF